VHSLQVLTGHSHELSVAVLTMVKSEAGVHCVAFGGEDPWVQVHAWLPQLPRHVCRQLPACEEDNMTSPR